MTPVERFFEERFLEVYGADAAEYLMKEYPVPGGNGSTLFLDYVVEKKDGTFIAVEENGVSYHHPQLIGEKQYGHQLDKQNRFAGEGIKLYRFSSEDCRFPDRIREEILRYFGKKEDFRPRGIRLRRDVKLYEHQEISLRELERQREENPVSATALIVLPTATGKTKVILEDLKKLYKENPSLRVLAASPTAKLVEQWRSVFDSYGFPREQFECGTYQMLSRREREVMPDWYDYIIIDEAHHAAAPAVSRAISYFTPRMLVGLTATPERMDGKTIDTIFGHYAVNLRLQDAMEKGIISPVRVFRIETNLDFSNIRYRGKDYINADLEKRIAIDSRDIVIAETINTYLEPQALHGLVFCVSVEHSRRLAATLNASGISAVAVSGDDRLSQEKIRDFERGKYNLLCSCSMISEGWDDPGINLVVMARPTLSKTLYLQQLGRGLRKKEGKESLIVLDVVDEYGAMFKPWSTNAIFSCSSYVPFGIIGHRYTEGEMVEVYGYHERVERLIELDISTFEEKHKDMLSAEMAARELFVSTGTLLSWVKKGEVKPSEAITLGKSNLYYFTEECLERIREEKNLKKHTTETLREDFFEFVREKQFTFSFKIVFMLSLFKHLDRNGEADIEKVLDDYISYYAGRLSRGLPVDRKNCVYDKELLEDRKAMRASMLTNPFEKFERKRFIYYGKDIALLSFNPELWRTLSKEDMEEVKDIMEGHLEEYYAEMGGK